MAHHVRHRHADTALLVVQQQRGPAFLADADLQQAVRVVLVEGDPVHQLGVVDLDVAVVEKGDMGRLLARHALADVAVAFVVVDGLGSGSDMDVLATASVVGGPL